MKLTFHLCCWNYFLNIEYGAVLNLGLRNLWETIISTRGNTLRTVRQAKNRSICEEIGPEDSSYSWSSRTLLGTDQPWWLFSFYHVSTKSRTEPGKFDRNTKLGIRQNMEDDCTIKQWNFETLRQNRRKTCHKRQNQGHHNKNFHCGLGWSKLCCGSIERSRHCIWNCKQKKIYYSVRAFRLNLPLLSYNLWTILLL